MSIWWKSRSKKSAFQETVTRYEESTIEASAGKHVKKGQVETKQEIEETSLDRITRDKVTRDKVTRDKLSRNKVTRNKVSRDEASWDKASHRQEIWNNMQEMRPICFDGALGEKFSVY